MLSLPSVGRQAPDGLPVFADVRSMYPPLIGLSFFVLMHTVSFFGICQGMSWQHLN